MLNFSERVTELALVATVSLCRALLVTLTLKWRIVSYGIYKL